MFIPKESNVPYTLGIAVSFVGHIGAFFLSMYLVSVSQSSHNIKHEVFSVTIEGGEKLGGVSQVPTEEVDPKKALPKTAQPATEPEAAEETVTKVESNTILEEQKKKKAEEKKAEEAKKKAEEVQKIALEKKKEEERKKAEEAKKKEEERKKAAEEKKKAEERKKKEEAQKKLDAEKQRAAQKEKEAQAKKDRDRLLQRAIRKAETRYKGESANAGGEGFGAARLGGRGMGGGTMASLEFIAYRNRLEQLFKREWKWLPGAARLVAQVEVTIMPDGTIHRASVVGSSGNSNFDDSAVRAVLRASPVPAAPADLYDKFRVVRITFDSDER